MLMLKAAVFGTEQKLAAKTKSGRLRGSHEVRESTDVFKRKNKGVDSRQEKEDMEFSKRRRTEDRVSAALRVKAEMYDKLSAEGHGVAESSLIDFSAKQKDTKASASTDKKNNNMAPPEPARSPYEPPPPIQQHHHQEQQPKWAWSRGREHINDAEEVKPPSKLLSPEEMERRIDEVRMSSGARVKSQWEKILTKEARPLLEQIHASTQQHRSAQQTTTANCTEEGKLSAKEQRRRLLMQKRQEIMLQSSANSSNGKL